MGAGWGIDMRGISYGVYASSKSATLPFNPLTAVTWAAAGWANDPLWTNPGNGNPVDSWRNASGGGDMYTYTDSPIFRGSVTSYNNRAMVEFSSSSYQSMTLSAPVNIAANYTLVIIGSMTSVSSTQALMGFGTSTYNGVGMVDNKFFASSNPSAPMLSNYTNDTSLHILTAKLGTASGELQIDGSTYASGNSVGSALYDVTIGMSLSNDVYLDGRIAFWGVYSGNLIVNAKYGELIAWVGSYYGVW